MPAATMVELRFIQALPGGGPPLAAAQTTHQHPVNNTIHIIGNLNNDVAILASQLMKNNPSMDPKRAIELVKLYVPGPKTTRYFSS